MTTELFYLCWACVLGLVHAVATGQFTTLQHGIAYGLSSRDEQKAVTGTGGRVQRAFANFMQTFALFAAAVLIGHVLNRHGWNTAWGARLYFWGRLAYVFLYAFDVVGARTVAFLVATLGIVMVLLGLT